jgi:dTDP-4-dehydrorhamnose reductase
MRAIVTGVRGLLGQALVGEARARGHEVIGTARRGSVLQESESIVPLELGDPAATRRFLAGHPAHFIIHAAALTDVDACEERPTEARAVHVDATQVLARAAADRGMGFLLVSTDSVFSGAGAEHSEDSPARPLNVYARTKREGEESALAAHPAALVVRTNFFGSRSDGSGRSLAEWALRELVGRRRIGGFTDVRFNPLWSGHLSGLLFDLMESHAAGILHVASSEALSKHEFLVRLAREFGFDTSLVFPREQEGVAWRAPRPPCTVLSVTRAERLLGRTLPDVTAGLRSFHQWAIERGLACPTDGERHGDQ